MGIEQVEGRLAEPDHHLGDLFLQPLAGPQDERHTLPAPVVDVKAHRGEGLGGRFGRDPVLADVGGHVLAVDVAGGVLSGHRLLPDILRCEPAHGAQYLHLLVAHGIGGELDRRLHGHQRHQLHQVALDHVAQRTGVFVVFGAVLDAEGLGHRYLDMVDVVAVPQRFHDAVSKAVDQQVLHRLLAEVVVDAKDLRFIDDRLQFPVQVARRAEIHPEGLLDDKAPVALVLAGEAGPVQPGGRLAVPGGRDGAVEHGVLAPTQLFQGVRQPGVGALVVEIAGHHPEACGEGLPACLIHADRGREFSQPVAHQLQPLVLVHVAHHTEDAAVRVHQAAVEHAHQCRHELALGQVAGGAEDDDVGGCRGLC